MNKILKNILKSLRYIILFIILLLLPFGRLMFKNNEKVSPLEKIKSLLQKATADVPSGGSSGDDNSCCG